MKQQTLIKNRSMEPFHQIVEKATTPLVIDIPAEFSGKKVEVLVRLLDEPDKQAGKKYDLSEFFGKLEWEGDAVAEQRKLRDEWD